MYRHLLDSRPGHNLAAWIFKVARNQILKRSERRNIEVNLAWADSVLDDRLDPEEAALRAQQQNRLAAVVRALSEQDRECLVLRTEGLCYRDIAGVQGRSLGAVCLSLKRSLAKLSEVCGR